MSKEDEKAEGRFKCPECDGDGFVMTDYPYTGPCPKCKGRGSLDWVENIMGVVGTYIKSGVYIKDVDYSEKIKR